MIGFRLYGYALILRRQAQHDLPTPEPLIGPRLSLKRETVEPSNADDDTGEGTKDGTDPDRHRG